MSSGVRAKIQPTVINITIIIITTVNIIIVDHSTSVCGRREGPAGRAATQQSRRCVIPSILDKQSIAVLLHPGIIGIHSKRCYVTSNGLL